MFQSLLNLVSLVGALLASNDDAKVAAAGRVIGIVDDLARLGQLTKDKLQVLEAQIQSYVSNGVEPSESDWAEMGARSDAAHARIQDADLSGGDGSTEPENGDSGDSGGDSGENTGGLPTGSVETGDGEPII